MPSDPSAPVHTEAVPETPGSDPSDGAAPASTTPADETQVSPFNDVALVNTGKRPDAPISRVIDVPLTVTLRFGQRQMTLRELLELNTGSLVELDQQVEEPVHLMLGERVIARGEVVIVDGNYGMRVLEVVEQHPGGSRIPALGSA